MGARIVAHRFWWGARILTLLTPALLSGLIAPLAKAQDGGTKVVIDAPVTVGVGTRSVEFDIHVAGPQKFIKRVRILPSIVCGQETGLGATIELDEGEWTTADGRHTERLSIDPMTLIAGYKRVIVQTRAFLECDRATGDDEGAEQKEADLKALQAEYERFVACLREGWIPKHSRIKVQVVIESVDGDLLAHESSEVRVTGEGG